MIYGWRHKAQLWTMLPTRRDPDCRGDESVPGLPAGRDAPWVRWSLGGGRQHVEGTRRHSEVPGRSPVAVTFLDNTMTRLADVTCRWCPSRQSEGTTKNPIRESEILKIATRFRW